MATDMCERTRKKTHACTSSSFDPSLFLSVCLSFRPLLCRLLFLSLSTLYPGDEKGQRPLKNIKHSFFSMSGQVCTPLMWTVVNCLGGTKREQRKETVCMCMRVPCCLCVLCVLCVCGVIAQIKSSSAARMGWMVSCWATFFQPHPIKAIRHHFCSRAVLFPASFASPLSRRSSLCNPHLDGVVGFLWKKLAHLKWIWVVRADWKLTRWWGRMLIYLFVQPEF